MKRYYLYKLFICPNGQIFFVSEELSYPVASNIDEKEIIRPYINSKLSGYQLVSAKTETEARQLFKDFLENSKAQQMQNHIDAMYKINKLLDIVK